MKTKINLTHRKVLTTMIMVLISLIAIVSLGGLLNNNLYTRETHNWFVQCIAQDAIDLFFIVPLLMISTVFMFRGSLKWTYIWLGTMLYNFYSFILYCFIVHFNVLFLLYCAILGLTFYTVLLFIISVDKIILNKISFTIKSARAMAYLLLFVAISFLFLWLSDIIPAIIQNQMPVTVTQGGMFTNPVHVIDLAFLIPAMIILGIAIFKKNIIASLIAPVFLCFSFVMSFALFVMMLYMFIQNEASSFAPSIMMIVLSIIGFIIFITLKEKTSNEHI